MIRPLWFASLILSVVALVMLGCSFGPKTLLKTRLPYNEAVKVTSEEQLLLNIVRLRYSDNPSSLSISNIAAQFELVKRLQLVPFFTATGDALPRSYASELPGFEVNGADRPTLSYTPQDEAEFARRLFTPLALDGIAYLAKTTWPISTVFRLYLENLNWVPNAQSVSGPLPRDPPEFEDFLRGIRALQRLQDQNKMAVLVVETDERVGSTISASRLSARDLVEAAKANHEFKLAEEVEDGKTKEEPPDNDKDEKKEKGEKGEKEKPNGKKEDKKDPQWSLTKKKDVPFLYIQPEAVSSPDWQEFCRTFRVKPNLPRYEIEVTKLNPFSSTYPREGVKVIDLETRSLLQVLYFVSAGVEIPSEHLHSGIVRATLNSDGSLFDYDRVLGGLFKVRSCCSRRRPDCASVAVCYQGYWYYIDAADHDTRTTFALLLALSRLELGSKSGGSPVLTLPVGGR